MRVQSRAKGTDPLRGASAQGPDSNKSDDKDIRSIGAQIQQPRNKSDARMLADLRLTDGDYVSSTGRTATGRAEVEKAFATQWARVYKGIRLTHTLTSVRGGHAVPPGSPPPTPTGPAAQEPEVPEALRGKVTRTRTQDSDTRLQLVDLL